MKNTLATLLCLCSLSALSSSVNAQQGRAAGWVLPGDTGLCLRGGVAAQNACARVRWTFYTWPNILKEIENAMIRNAPVPVELDPKYSSIILDAVASPGDQFLPNSVNPDRSWGSIGPVVREGLVLNTILLEVFSNPQSAYKDILDETLLSPTAIINDMAMVRKALDQTIKTLDMHITSLQKE